MPFCAAPAEDALAAEALASDALQAGGAQTTDMADITRVDRPLVCAINHDKDRERDERTTVIVMQPFGYEHPASGRMIWVPATYVTDFASIPRVGRWLIPPFGRHAIAAVIHDALDELGVDMVRRNVMHGAVRSFGSGGYGRAAELWPTSFMDWRTGDHLPPPAAREAFFGEPDSALIERITTTRPVNCG
jgi:hypothetical protein